ncbi:MAG: chorismate mutase [Chloroflexi bacterium]|nr:chorismate mutase [Chloroflexota bacterium]
MNTNGINNRKQVQRAKVCRGVRGAITVNHNEPEEILAATRELLQRIIAANGMLIDDIASVYFTTTVDLNSSYPAAAARQLGWQDVALMCAHEMNVPESLPRCIRVMIHWNTVRAPKEIAHVYLREARSLRPDRKDVPLMRPRQVNAMEAMMRVLEASL